MNNEEIQALMEKLKAAGLTPEDIANGILWPLFKGGKMSKEDLDTLLSSIGLEMDPEFKDDDGPAAEGENKGAGDGASAPAAEGVTQEEAENLKEIKPGESKEEFQEKVEEAKGDKPAESNDDEKEWGEARKLFKL